MFRAASLNLRSYWQSYFNQWLDKRIPKSRQFSLDINSIFILPSRFGWLFLLLCFGLFLLGTNYQNNLMLWMAYFLTSLCLLNLFVSYLNFSRLTVTLGKITPVFATESAMLPLWFDNEQRPNGFLHVHVHKSQNANNGQASLSIDLDDIHQPMHFPLLCRFRGLRPLPRLTFESFYPLGLFRCWTHLSFDSDVLIYPQPIEGSVELVSGQSKEQSQKHQSNSQPGHEDFDTLKQYVVGDPLKHVAWKQVAKGQGMLTKRFASDTAEARWLTLNAHHGFELEKSLSALSYAVVECSRKGQVFGLDLGGIKIEPGNSTEHQVSCLKALALYGGKKHAE